MTDSEDAYVVDSEGDQDIDWEQVVARNSWYALVLSGFIMIDDVITSRSLDVPHPFINAIPLAVFFIFLSVALPVNPISDMVDERFDSPMAVYTTLCVILGIIWIIV